MDIATILHLMMGGQTPQQNSGYGLTTDSSSPNLYDENGILVTDAGRIKDFKKYGGTTPYKPITGLDATFNPAAANYVSQQNNAGFQSDYERGIKRHLVAEDLQTLPTDLYADPKAPLAANVTLNSGGTTAPSLESAQQAVALMRGKVPQARATEAGTTAQAGTENALNSIQSSQADRARFPIVSEYMDTRANNELYREKGSNRRLPLADTLENTQLSTANINAMIADKLADNRLNLMGALRGTDTNRILAEHYQSGILPPSPYPYGTSITPQGTFRPGTLDPNFVSLMKMKMAGYGQDTSPNVGPIIDKGSSGRIALPISNPTEFGSDRQPINNRAGALPSTGAPVSASAPKGSNINNVSIGTHLAPISNTDEFSEALKQKKEIEMDAKLKKFLEHMIQGNGSISMP